MNERMVQDISAQQLKELLKNREKLEIIDVREPTEYRIIRLKGSKLIPMNELTGRLDEIDWSKKVIFICRSGSRSRIMANLVSAKGRDIKNLNGGIYECFKDKNCPDLEILKDDLESYFKK